MTLRTIFGLTFAIERPNEYRLLSRNIWVIFDGQGWFAVGYDGPGEELYIEGDSRDQIIKALAWAFQVARQA